MTTSESNKNNTLALKFISEMIKANSEVSIFLLRGVRLKGIIKEVDNYSLILENDGKKQLVLKESISTIVED